MQRLYIYHWLSVKPNDLPFECDNNGPFIEFEYHDFFEVIDSLSRRYDVMIKRDQDNKMIIWIDDLGRRFRQR